MKDQLKPWEVATIVLSGLLLMCYLTSCHPVRNVLADINKVKQVRAATDALFPCVNDTTVIKTHSTDTLVLTNTRRYTDTLRRHDTLYIFHTDTAEFERVRTVYKNSIVTDHTREDSLRILLIKERTTIAGLNATITEKNTRIGEARADARKWIAWLIGSIIVLVGSNVLWLKSGSILKLFKK